MSVEIMAIIGGISSISKGFLELNKSFSFLKDKFKDKHDEDLENVENKIQDLNDRIFSISEGADSINAYFELYSYALDLYTTADDFIKIQSKAPEQTRNTFAYMNYSNLDQKFAIGLDSYLTRFNGYVDQDDEGTIQTNIKTIRDLLVEVRTLLVTKNEKDYEELEKKLGDLTRITNQLRGLSRAKLLRLVDALQKAGRMS